MKNRTQYTKYHDKMKKLIKECNMGDFSFVEDRTFDEYGEYFLKTIKKESTFKLYRYMSLYRHVEENNKIISVFNLDDFENLYLSKNGSQNDVFEGLPYSDDYDMYTQDECVEKLTNLAYIKCFSESNKNNLMWAHYADSYKGVCVEYDISKLTDTTVLKQIFPVCYLETRRMFGSIEHLMEYIKQETEEKELRDTKGIFLAKSNIWKYEKEWRICYMNHDLCYEKTKKIPFDCVSAVYIGNRTEKDDIKQVIKKLNSYSERHNRKCDDRIKLYKMKMPKDNSYNLTCEVYNY